MAYSYAKRPKILFDPTSATPYRISRSKIDQFMNCPLCSWLDHRKGISQPSTPPFTLNSAVDTLLKKEFDIHRAKKTKHPLLEKYGVDAIPFSHPKIDVWRANFTGINYLHHQTNFEVFGAIDDIWEDAEKKLHIVDYKATSKQGEVQLEDTKWHNQYRRQMEIYQWLFRHNGFDISDTGYFVYVNGKKDRAAFDGKLEFDVKLIAYKGKDQWIEGVLYEMKEVLSDSQPPMPHADCEYCIYRASVNNLHL